ncbi:MAG TPA: glycosyltransferase family 4 protein [Candidatus Binataceae bacterium]|nr:glycosyltransferase family 4 protein [Candidatus Binataceae bacterium]
MRIALLTRRYDPAGGGTERDLIVTADHLRRAGHELTIYASEIRGDPDGVKVRRVGGRGPRALALLQFGLAAGAVARRDGAELVVSFARVAEADVFRSGGSAHACYLRAARLWRGRLSAAAMWLSPYHCLQMYLERRGFRSHKLRKAIAVSNLVRDELNQQFALGEGIAITLYNGVDLERFRPCADAHARSSIRARYAIPTGVRMVAFVGNGFGRKGLRALVEAWPLLPRAAWLLVAGADRAVSSYQERARELGVDARIVFAGPLPDAREVFAAADAFALPSLFEPFGNAALEAMACGLPVLTTSRCGVAESVPPEMRAYIVERPTDPGEIALRLGELLEAPKGLPAAARGAAEQFTWTRYGAQLNALLDSLS